MIRDLTLAVAAQLIEYPHPGLAPQARAAAAWLEVGFPDAAALARSFAARVDGLSLGALEEAYTAAFDFATLGTVYAGEHLFGATQGRASFLARLKVLQRDHGLTPSPELPDHVAELLRLAASMPPGGERDELLRDAVLPTARAALEQLQSSGHAYADALAAVVAVVRASCGAPAESGAPAVAAAADVTRIGAPQPRPAPRSDPADDDIFSPSPEATP